MDREPTQKEVADRARELARRVMSQPPQKQEWPKKDKPTKSRDGASKPGKRAPTGKAS